MREQRIKNLTKKSFQEPISNDDYPSDKATTNSLSKNDEQQISPNSHTTVSNSTENVTPSSSLTSLIKVIILFFFLKSKKTDFKF